MQILRLFSRPLAQSVESGSGEGRKLCRLGDLRVGCINQQNKESALSSMQHFSVHMRYPQPLTTLATPIQRLQQRQNVAILRHQSIEPHAADARQTQLLVQNLGRHYIINHILDTAL